MNIRIVKLDLTETNEQLRRIADLLEAMLGATDPLRQWVAPDENVERVFYTNDRQEIIENWMNKLGKGHLSTRKE